MKKLDKDEEFLVSYKEENKQMQPQDVRLGRDSGQTKMRKRRTKTMGTSIAFARRRRQLRDPAACLNHPSSFLKTSLSIVNKQNK